jgi:5-oxoprolinase (ATP-hydrolysing)/N-methylhydantoinase A
MRYRGQGHELNVELPARDYTGADAATLQDLFDQQYRKTYSRTIPNLGVEALTWMLVLVGKRKDMTPEPARANGPVGPAPIERTKPVFDGEIGKFVTASVIRRDAMQQGSTFSGPSVGVRWARQRAWPPHPEAAHIMSSDFQKIRNQVMWDRLIAVVEEQARTMMRVAFSTVVREAGDLSAGVFNPSGQLLAQAVTGTPGHINSMARSVKQFMQVIPPI